MTASRQMQVPAQTPCSEFILAKISKKGVFYFFTGTFNEVGTKTGRVLTGQTGFFPGDAFSYESKLTAQRIANQLNHSGVGSHWHVVPASTPYEIPFAPIVHPGERETAPPAA